MWICAFMYIYIYIYIHTFIYIYIYIYGCCPIPPCFLTTLPFTKRHGVQAKRSHLYTIMHKHTRKHMCYCTLYNFDCVLQYVPYIWQRMCGSGLIFGSLLSLFHSCLNMINGFTSVFQVFLVVLLFQCSAENRWASFVQVFQVFQAFQHFANNSWAPMFCVKTWETWTT